MAKTIVITGSTSGLGKATAEHCLALGANVVVSSESEEDLAATLEEFGESANVAGHNRFSSEPQLPSRKSAVGQQWSKVWAGKACIAATAPVQCALAKEIIIHTKTTKE